MHKARTSLRITDVNLVTVSFVLAMVSDAAIMAANVNVAMDCAQAMKVVAVRTHSGNYGTKTDF